MIRCILLLLAATGCLPLFSQKEGRLDLRPVVLNGRDSTVQAYILIGNLDYKPISSLTYYWYYSERINCNQGGYAGNLLHDAYIRFDGDKHLIEKGAFNQGLKTGTWLRWYPDGKLESAINWKAGLLDGRSQYYNNDGSIYLNLDYKAGKKDGKQISFENDSLVTRYYKNGIERQPLKCKFYCKGNR
jgi:hypothetical protein